MIPERPFNLAVHAAKGRIATGLQTLHTECILSPLIETGVGSIDAKIEHGDVHCYRDAMES